MCVFFLVVVMCFLFKMVDEVFEVDIVCFDYYDYFFCFDFFFGKVVFIIGGGLGIGFIIIEVFMRYVVE